jgi:hypothetical protein
MYNVREGVDRSRLSEVYPRDPFVTEGLADPRILEWNAVRFA